MLRPLVVTIAVLIAGTPPLFRLACLSGFPFLRFRCALCREVACVSGPVPGPVPVRSFIHSPCCTGPWGHRAEQGEGPDSMGRSRSSGMGRIAYEPCQQAQALDLGCLVNPKFPSRTPHCSHPFCWCALIPAGVGETRDVEDTPILVLWGTWEGIR